ncbi:helix-turn-helix transcriptional regulator [Candidatus Gottesmanbacteria bacterium]|nr:helix-turn-helix transcriptional regulator [Candidatus Gottesmanbacteria bacterium]
MATIFGKLGIRIKDLRKKAGLSQEELAERAKLDLTSISEIESGLRNPSVKTIHKIALALKVTLKDLLSD